MHYEVIIYCDHVKLSFFWHCFITSAMFRFRRNCYLGTTMRDKDASTEIIIEITTETTSFLSSKKGFNAFKDFMAQ